MLDLNGVRLRNRLLTSASLLGYGGSDQRLILYGLSPIAQWVPLDRFGAVTTRTLTLAPREGHFNLREHWKVTEFPQLYREYQSALRKVDAGWINAFGWCNIGIERYFDEYFPRTHELNRIVSLGGFSAEDFEALVDVTNRRAAPGTIAAVEFNLSCHNVNFPFDEILESVLARAVPASRHPVIVKLSPDTDYVAAARLAARYGAAALTAVNGVKALRLDPRSGEPLLKNGFGSITGRAIKPIGLRVVAELREQGIRLPIIATAGIRTYKDCREFFWAGADAVSLGSAVWLASLPGYALGPVRSVGIRRLIRQVERSEPPRRAPSDQAEVITVDAPDGLARDLAEAAVLRGDFQLRSGARSDYYIDKYRISTQPELLRRVTAALAGQVPPGAEYVAGTVLGAVPLAISLSLTLQLPAVLVRTEAKDHGPSGAIEGRLPAGARVALIEDVVTTGGAVLSAAETLRAAGAQVTKILAVVDRESGAAARMAAAGLPYQALFTSSDLGINSPVPV